MQDSQKKTHRLFEELAHVKAQLEELRKEVEHITTFNGEAAGRIPFSITVVLTRSVVVNPCCFLVVEQLGMLKKDLEHAREDAHYSQSQESVGHRVLGHQTMECSRLKDANAKLAEEKDQQGQELEKLKSQLDASKQEAKQACEFLAGNQLPVRSIFLDFFVLR